MRLTNRQITNIHNVLILVGEKEIEDSTLAFKIAKTNFKLMSITDPIQKVKNDLLRKYGEKNEKGDLLTKEGGKVTIVDVDCYNREMDKLMETETEIDLEYFSEKEVKHMRATPNQIALLFPVIR